MGVTIHGMELSAIGLEVYLVGLFVLYAFALATGSTVEAEMARYLDGLTDELRRAQGEVE